MHVTLRPANPADAPPIAQVQVASWHSTYRTIVPDSYLAQLTVPGQIDKWAQWLAFPGILTFVAESNSDLVGFCSGGPIREPHAGFTAELYAIYLLQPWQGQGIGRRLVLTLATALAPLHSGGLLAWVLEANPAVRFYQCLGATEQHRKRITLGDADLPEIAFGWPDLRSLARA